MKKICLSLALALGAAPLVRAGVPVVDPASVSAVQQGAKVIVTYTLTGEKGIVTVDLQTNTLADASGEWVSIGEDNLTTLSGAANCLVSELNVPQTVTWKPAKEPFAAGRDGLGKIRAVVRAWSVTAPPDYLVVDLLHENCRAYYTSTNALPDGGLANDKYRTTHLVMRRIPAAGVTFTMGPNLSERKQYPDQADYLVGATKRVAFEQDYYMAIYHLTQAQATNIYPQVYQSWHERGDTIVFAVVRWQDVRGACTAGSDYDWPTKGHAVDPDSLIGRLNTRSGIEFDLPTEAQWEFACRAGTDTYWNDSHVLADRVGELACYGISGTAGYGAATVGTKRPSAWGLYDMHGLIWDMCLDWFVATDSDGNGKVLVDPVGPTTGDVIGGATYRVRRGGGWGQAAAGTRTACRHRGDITNGSNYNGWRLVCPVGLKW